jgi:pheromone shutdown protein TraB
MMVALCAAAASMTPVAPRSGAIIQVYDPKTRSHIKIVGTMHFNPRSIVLAREVVNAEAASGQLRAVAVESCQARWNATLDAQPAGSFLRLICDNEMQSAAEAGESAGVETVLVDQDISLVGKRVAQIFAGTAVDLLTPWSGGWNRIYEDFAGAFAQVSGGDGGDGERVGAYALLEPRLLLGAPVSLVRYPLSLGFKSPALGLVLVLIGLIASQDPTYEDTLADLVGAAIFATLETIVLGRILLVGLLEERNYILARNIRKACFDAKPGGSVVAVMGMAHCNGVASLLSKSRIM